MSEHCIITINGKEPHKRHGRKKPFTSLGIARLPCVRCGAKALHQWQICADGNIYRPLCLDCDIALNLLVLKWSGDPDAATKIKAYEASERRKLGQLWHPELGWHQMIKILDELRVRCVGVKDGITRHLLQNSLLASPP